MKKINPILWKIAYSLALGIVALQAFFGMLWMLSNVCVVPGFAETEVLLNASEDWLIDEYLGVAYVALVFLFRKINDFVGLPFQIPIYLMQLGLGVYSTLAFLKAILGKKTTFAKMCMWAISIYVNTIPFLLQSHFAILPYSLAGSLHLLMVASIYRCLKGKELFEKGRLFVKNGLLILGLWVLGGLVTPEYYIINAVAVFAAAIVVLLKHKKLWVKCAVYLLIGILTSTLFYTVSIEDGCRGRMANTVQAQAARRLAWPNIYRTNGIWPKEVRYLFTVEEQTAFSIAPERMVNSFGPKLEAAYGKEQANEIYAEMAFAAIRYNTKETLGNIGIDMGAYLCPQLMVLRNTEGVGATYTGINIEKLQWEKAFLTNAFVEWSKWAMILFGIVAMLHLPWYIKKLRSKMAGMGLLVLLQTLCYTWISGGMVDYLKVPVNWILWGVFATIWLMKKEEEKAHNDSVEYIECANLALDHSNMSGDASVGNDR